MNRTEKIMNRCIRLPYAICVDIDDAIYRMYDVFIRFAVPCVCVDPCTSTMYHVYKMCYVDIFAAFTRGTTNRYVTYQGRDDVMIFPLWYSHEGCYDDLDDYVILCDVMYVTSVNVLYATWPWTVYYAMIQIIHPIMRWYRLFIQLCDDTDYSS